MFFYLYCKISRVRISLIVLFVCLYLNASTALSQNATTNLLSNKPTFQQLTNDDGLSQGSINDIVQDKKGFIWIGTDDGLNRYDGYNIIEYRKSIKDTSSLSSNQINNILVDNQNHLWIGTDNGLNFFNPNGTTFKHVLVTDSINSVTIHDMDFDKEENIWIVTQDNILIKYSKNGNRKYIPLPYHDDPRYKTIGRNKIFVDSNSNIWLGLKCGGLHRYIPEKGLFEEIDPGDNIPGNVDNFKITSIIEDDSGNLWLGSYLRSIIYYNIQEQNFTYYKNNQVFNDSVFAIAGLCLSGDTLWIGTFDRGLIALDLKSNEWTEFREGISKNNVLYRTVNVLFVDRDKNLWIGTNGRGINVLSPYFKKFFFINNDIPSSIQISFSSIRSIYQDDEMIIWIGGYNGFERLDIDLGTSDFIRKEIIFSICPDPVDKNKLWLGSEGGGIFSFDKPTKKFSKFVFNKTIETIIDVEQNVYGMQVYDIEFKNDSMLFAGTNIGIVEINTFTGLSNVIEFGNDEGKLPHGKVYNIDFDKDGILRVSSGKNGIFEFSANDGSFNRPFSGKGNYPETHIFSIHETDDGIFWLGTDMGLCMMDTKNENFTYLTVNEGLPNNVVYSVLEDRNKNLWLSTNKGISKYNPTSGRFYNFDINDGLPGNEFNGKAFFQGDDYFYFGGVNGLVIFNPDEILVNPQPPKVEISQLIKYSNQVVIKQNGIGSDKIEIKPDENVIELNFSAFEFSFPKSCMYKYRMLGFNKKWIELGNSHSIVFNNLNPGRYQLEILASNSDGIWSENPKRIEMKVIPKFVETITFKLILILLFLLIVGLIYYGRLKIIKKQNIELETKILDQTKELVEANDELRISNATKDKFFSIIAHDLKNPFNSLLGFSELLQEEWFTMEESKRLELVRVMHKTIDETFQLLTNLLDWSRLQRNKLKWVPESIDMHESIHLAISQVNSLAIQKDLSIIPSVSQRTFVYADKEMITTVLRNLLSNAIKFTQQRGRIMVYTRIKDSMVNCCIEDSGVGIDPQFLSSLFEYGQNETTLGTNGEKGTGLGLILCKELMQINKGEISVKSKVGRGSTFCISLPVASEPADK